MGMKNRFQEAIQNVQRQRHLARRSVAMVLVLAMLTAMSVSWRLHQDGIALAADDTRYYCGKEEHKHTDDCYIEGTEPICGYEEGEIVEETVDSADGAGDGDSSVADWDEAGSEPESEPATQEEPEPEVVLHHHTADCYEEEEVLTCGIESDHVHQDYCYDQETGELLCTEHEHTDDCYTLEEVLVCGQEEGEPEKTDDGAALYDTDENSAEESDSAEEPETVADPEPEQEATKPETDAEIDTGYTVHHHTDECYGKVLICGKEEHEHTAACLVNPNAEIDAEYDAKTPDRTSVDWAQDMVLVARSQLGYTESKADVDEDGNGYTMYADQYYKDKPMVYADWDSTFVAYCLYHAGVPQDIIPQYASISALRGELARMNSEYYTDDPQEFASILPGDIVMYKNAEGRETIGVVSDAAVDEETDLTTALTVISGDVATGCESDGETTIDQVAEVSVALSEVTSFVSVNAAEGYGISDLMDGEQGMESLDVVVTGTPVDLAKLNPTITALKKTGSGNNDYGPIEDGYEFTEGDSVKIEGKFKIKSSDFAGADSNTVTWDIGLKLPAAVSDRPITALVKNEKGETIKTVEIGKLSITEDGKASFVFDREKIDAAADAGYDVDFWLTATAEVQGDQDKETITFPGVGTTITVKKQSDISVQKSSADKAQFQYDDDGNPYIQFEVKVSTKKGTHGTVDIQDIVNPTKDIKGDYDKKSFVLEKYAANGTLQSSSTLKENEKLKFESSELNSQTAQSFQVTGLDKLEAGEYYVLKYKYKLDKTKCKDEKLSGSFENCAKAKYENGGWTAPSWWNTTYQARLQKSGSYDAITGQIRWEVLVRNPYPFDLKDYVVEDTLGTSGVKILGTVEIYAGDKENSMELQTEEKVTYKENNAGFTYKFGANSTRKYYKFIYYTNAVGEKVDNKATISKNQDRESVDAPTKVNARGIYVGKGPGANANQKLEDVAGNNNLKKAPKWFFTVATPTNWDGKSFEVWDWFVPVTKGTAKADHYALYGELKKQLNSIIQIYTTETGSSGKDVSWAASKKIEITYEMYQDYTVNADGKGVIGQTLATADNDKVRAFKIKVDFTDSTAGNVWKLNVGYIGYTGYSSYIDTTGMTMDNGKQWEIYNKIASLGSTEKGTYFYQKEPGKNTLEKMVSNDSSTGSGHYFMAPGQDGKFDYKESGTTIWYKLWLEVDGSQDTIRINDTLPKGMVLDTAQSPYAFYAEESDKQKSISVDDSVKYPAENFTAKTTTDVNDQQVITFTLSNVKQNLEKQTDKKKNRIAIAYCVKVDDPDFWGTLIESEKPYVNTASWEGVADATATAVVKRDSTYLTKSSEYTDGRSTVKYVVDINPQAQKLNPKEAYLDFEDDFTVPKRATAKLDRDSVKLYRVDANGTQTEEQITEMTTSSKKINAEETKYVIKIKVPDAVHYKLEYVYELDTSKANAMQITLKNQATVGAAWQSSDGVQYNHVNAGASASTAGQIRVLKVAANDEQKVLPGVEFELYKYNSANNAFEKVGNTLTTRTDGTILMTPGAEASYDVASLQTNVLYKLVETKSLDGYVNSGTPYYFIWLAQGKDDTNGNEKEAYKAATGASKETDLVGSMTKDERDNILYYVHGKSYELKVTNAAKKLDIEKIWKDAAGNVLSTAPDGITEIKVNIYRYPASEKFSNEHLTSGNLVETVTLNEANHWKATFTQLNDQYKYYVIEQELSNLYRTTYTNRDEEHIQYGYTNGDKVTITNQQRPTSLTVRKYWQGTNEAPLPDSLPDKVTVQLWKKGTGEVPDTKVEDSVDLTAAEEWSHTFTGLDPDGLYYVVETPEVNGFEVSYEDNNRNGVAPGGTIKVINTASKAPTYELPSTGSPGGTVPYTAGGAAIALAAVLCGYNSRRKRKRGEE